MTTNKSNNSGEWRKSKSESIPSAQDQYTVLFVVRMHILNPLKEKPIFITLKHSALTSKKTAHYHPKD
jgi:hypothetical protein